MRVHRKPNCERDWWDAYLVHDKDLTVEPWTKTLRIEFDGTKDKSSSRHSDFRIELSEQDVENLYEKLCQGRKNEIRENALATKEKREYAHKIFKQVEDLRASLLERGIKLPVGVSKEIEKIEDLLSELQSM